MKKFISVFIPVFLSAGFAVAADRKAEAPKPKKEPVPASAPAPVVESEKAKEWKGLQAQEQWVTRLKKQTEGEERQLSEMRASFAEKFKLDPKKFAAGKYTYDEKKDAFVER